MTDLSNLKRLTKELAEEIEKDEHGKVWDLVTFILDNIESPATVVSRDHKLLYINKETEKRFAEIGYKNLHMNKSLKDSPFCKSILGSCKICPIQETLETRKVHTNTFNSHLTGKVYRMVCIPLVFDGISGVLAILSDIDVK